MTSALILASSSVTRRRILENAGVSFRAISPSVNEACIKLKFQAQQRCVTEAVNALALAKAKSVSTQFPDNLVLGADQILTCNGQWFDKPIGVEGAQKQLFQLSGKKHELVNATVIIKRDTVLWSHESSINMEMRTLNKDFINAYIDRAGETVFNSVGAYDLEGLGIQLLSRAEGDFFSILGLPLFPLLEFLRECKIVPS